MIEKKSIISVTYSLGIVQLGAVCIRRPFFITKVKPKALSM